MVKSSAMRAGYCTLPFCTDMDKNSVVKEVKSAFSGVTLGDGIGLWEAQAIDDYESEDTRRQYREKDRKQDWLAFDSDELQRCHSSLSFFDADGMRFHLPAYILASLDGKVDDPLFHLTMLDDYGRSRFTTLNLLQRKAIAIYLRWCLERSEYEFEHATIRRVLGEFWA